MENKPFLNLDQKIELLISRRLTIENHAYAKKILLTTNYYYLVNGYSEFIFDFQTNKYKNNASFDDLLAIYEYDKDIKSALYPSLMRTESFISSIISHVFSEAYGGGYSYLNTANFNTDNSKTLDVSQLISACAAIIKRNQKSKSIK
ncbi:MAG: Abi family protein, partial [Culicoidibacterales bacterium]